MSDIQYSQIVLTHWNAGVFHATALPQLLPELAIYSLLYDEVLIREEDLLTNRAITNLLSDESNFSIFSELLVSGLVKLLRLPLEAYPSGRQFDPVRLPISARVEEHQLRRTYKGSRWQPTRKEWELFKRLDEIVTSSPSASRYHATFPGGTRLRLSYEKSSIIGSHTDSHHTRCFATLTNGRRISLHRSVVTPRRGRAFCTTKE